LKRICVIDGHGGGIGTALIRSLKKARGESLERVYKKLKEVLPDV